jgi:hypothetical protein
LCHFLHINNHSDYLVLLENCGFGTSITKACAAQLAELVGKDSSEFSEYTVYQPGKPRSTRSYLRLGSKNKNTNEIITKVKKQFKKGELIIFPKSVIHTCRLNKDEMGQLASLIETSLSHEKPANEDEEKSEQQEPEKTESTESAKPTHQPMLIESSSIQNSKIPSTNKRPRPTVISKQMRKKPCLYCGKGVNVPQMLEPEHIAAAKALASRLSDVALQDYKLRGNIVWKNSSRKRFDDCLQINSTHRRKAHQMELLLNNVASQDLETAGCILSCLLEKQDLNRVRTELLESGQKEKMMVDMQIIENIQEFLRYHKKPKY